MIKEDFRGYLVVALGPLLMVMMDISLQVIMKVEQGLLRPLKSKLLPFRGVMTELALLQSVTPDLKTRLKESPKVSVSAVRYSMDHL